jgi:hypothetical protein
MAPIEVLLSDSDRQTTILETVSDISERTLAENSVLAEKRLRSAVGNEGNDEAIFAKCLGLCYRDSVALVQADNDFLYLLGETHQHRELFAERGVQFVNLDKITFFSLNRAGYVYRVEAPLRAYRQLMCAV